MRYKVTVLDTFPEPNTRGRIAESPAVRHGLTLKQAWRYCERVCRRGVRLYGGTLGREAWGMTTTGDNHRAMLDRPCRYATIYSEVPRNMASLGTRTDRRRRPRSSEFVPKTTACPSCEGHGCEECQRSGLVFL